jgi:steroid delta-isomerase-like uncharacterized protein
MSISDTAAQFFDACDSGKGWEGAKQCCSDDATFSCQADALAEISTLDAYCDWMAGLFTPIPDLSYEFKSFSTDDERSCVTAFAVATGTQTGDGGPVPPTGNSVATEYVYVMNFEGTKISHVTKIWNDVHCLKQLGWM